MDTTQTVILAVISSLFLIFTLICSVTKKTNVQQGMLDENEEVINYDEKVGFETAKESLISLLQSKGVDTNKNLLIIEKI